MMDNQQVCCKCQSPFDKYSYGRLKRIKVSSLSSPRTAAALLPGLTGHLCQSCEKTFRKETKPVPGSWRRRTLNVNPSRRRKISTEDLEVAINALKRRKYKTLFKLLTEQSSLAKEAFLSTLQRLIRREILTTQQCSLQCLQGPVTMDKLDQFSWEGVISEATEKMPVISAAVDACVPSKAVLAKRSCVGPHKSRRNLTTDEAATLRQTKQGFLLSTVMYGHHPRKCSLPQYALGVELWRHGTSHSSFRALHNLGVCVGVSAARNAADIMSREHQQRLTTWKADIQARANEDPLPETDTTVSYSMCYDNIQLTAHRKHHTSEKANTFILGALGFAVRHRTPSLHLPTHPVRSVMSLPPSTFFPSPDDFLKLRSRMSTIVQRIITETIPALQSSRELVPRHLPHQYSSNMRERSETVNLGLVDANPSSIKGTIKILKHLNKYVPSVDGEVHPIPCNGDGLSVERMAQARCSSVDAKSPQRQLGGLVEVPQEFHKEGIQLQDTMNLHYKPLNLTTRGTLYNIREVFGHRGVKTNVMQNFQHVWDLVKFATEGFVIMQFMIFSGMSSMDETPANMPENSSNRKEWIEKLANRIVERCWREPSVEDMTAAMKAYSTTDDFYPFCHCNNDKGGPIVRCSNYKCNTQYFHVECCTEVVDEDDDWYCSATCRQSPAYIYCLCKQRLPDSTMIQCQLKHKCKCHQWYHLSCLGMDHDSIPDVWFCSEQCSPKEADGMFDYTMSLVRHGLNHLARRDAVREGDGEAMLCHWRIDLQDFWTNRHTKYVKIAHRFLSYAAGVLPPRLAHEITWERVANITGRSGGNIGLDLVNEFLINEFKEMTRRSRGAYTEENLQRCSLMGGGFSRHMTRLTSQAGISSSSNHRHISYTTDKAELGKFVQEYFHDKLLDFTPGRRSPAGVTLNTTGRIKKPKTLGESLYSHSDELSAWSQLSIPDIMS